MIRLGHAVHAILAIAMNTAAAKPAVGGCEGISLQRGKMIWFVLNGSSLNRQRLSEAPLASISVSILPMSAPAAS